MYATETYVRQEAKEVHAMVKVMATELTGDIRYLHQEIQQLSERLSLLEEQIRLVREENQ